MVNMANICTRQQMTCEDDSDRNDIIIYESGLHLKELNKDLRLNESMDIESKDRFLGLTRPARI